MRLHVYGLLIAAGVVAAVWLAQRRWEARGGKPGTMAMLALWGVPAGLIGARLYSVVTSWQADTGGHWYRVFALWQGGLGIWGGIVGGVAFGLVGARRHHLDWRAALDCATPGLILAQAIGRWGNYFNQELYGKPSGLPWAVKIDHPVHCSSVTNCMPFPPGVTTFQPTFLYESIWDLVCLGLILIAERRLRIRKGYLVFVYAALYTVGRFYTENLRIDEAHRYLGLRLNDWVSVGVFVISVGVLLIWGRAPRGESTMVPGALPASGDDPDNDGERDTDDTAKTMAAATTPSPSEGPAAPSPPENPD